MELQEDFNEQLYQDLIEKIVVHKDGTAAVIFKNKSSVRIGYGGQTAREGAGNGSDSSKEKGIHDTSQAAV